MTISLEAVRARRAAIKWLLFVAFAHTVPSFWYLAVAAGFAPAVAIFIARLGGSVYIHPGSLAVVQLFLLPAVGYLLVYFAAAWGLGALLARVPDARLRTGLVVAATGAPVLAAVFPIYVVGGHNTSESHNLIGLWTAAGLPLWGAWVYGAALVVLALALLWAQAAGHWFPRGCWRALWARRRARMALLVPPLAVVVAFVWVNRVLLVCRPLAEVGLASAQFCLGRALDRPAPNPFWGAEGADVWLSRAAEQGHGGAAMRLARRARTADERIRWLRVAADADVLEAQYTLYTLLARKYGDADALREAARWLRRSAEAGHAQAQFALAQAREAGTLKGAGVARDLEAARDWYQRAAAAGHRGARQQVAARLATGGGRFPLDPQRAVRIYRELATELRASTRDREDQLLRSADDYERQAREIKARQARLDAGDPDALRQEARRRLELRHPGPGVRASGIALLKRLAEAGDGEAAWELGAMFIYGRYDTPKDPARGHPWWIRAAEAGHREAMERVAAGFLNGHHGFPVDFTRGRPYVERLAEAYTAGPAADARQARYWRDHLSWMDHQIERMGGHYESPRTLVPKADQGDARAQYQLAQQILYTEPLWEHGRAMALLKSAAAAGHAGANWELYRRYQHGLSYRTTGPQGRGPLRVLLPKDPRKAGEHLMRAARAHHAQAMAGVALAYEKGRWGMPQDYEKARQWYKKVIEAAEQDRYGWEVDARFLPFQRGRLAVVERILTRRSGAQGVR